MALISPHANEQCAIVIHTIDTACCTLWRHIETIRALWHICAPMVVVAEEDDDVIL